MKYGCNLEGSFVFDSIDELLESYFENTLKHDIDPLDIALIYEYSRVAKLHITSETLIDCFMGMLPEDWAFAQGDVAISSNMIKSENRFIDALWSEVKPQCYKKTKKFMNINLYLWAQEHGYEHRIKK